MVLWKGEKCKKMNLRTLCFNIWKPKHDRMGISTEYAPVCLRYTGVDDMAEYPDIIKTLCVKSEQCPYSLFFDRSVPMQAEFNVIKTVGDELKSMDVRNLKSQDIVLFENADFNMTFLKALDRIVNLALLQETFFNDCARNDFILKLIVWTFSYVRPVMEKADASHSPKCFYYGDATKHEVYFMMMLHLMSFDVVYINPLRDDTWESVDTIGLSTKIKGRQITKISPLAELTRNAKEIHEEHSVTLQMQREMDSMLFSEGVYRPWQFRDGTTKSLFMKSTIIDLMNNYNEPAKVRAGFRTDGMLVTVPNLFFQIDGVYSDWKEYNRLVEICTSSENTIIITDAGRSLAGHVVPHEEKLKLVFCELSDGTMDSGELMKMDIYHWGKYRDALEDLMLEKINEMIRDWDCMFKNKISRELKFDIICDILSMDEKIIKMVDGFDYTGKIPKAVFFLENEDFIEDRILYIVGYMVTIGFDVVVFSPAGLMSIDSVFDPGRFNNERLDVMKYDCTYHDALKKLKKGSLGRLFESFMLGRTDNGW